MNSSDSHDGGQKQIVVRKFQSISISGVQEKLSTVVEKGKVCLTPESVQGRYIIKRFGRRAV